MCLAVSDHTHRKIVIKRCRKIRSSSGAWNLRRLSPTFEAVLYSDTTLDVSGEREVPWEYWIHLEDSEFSSGQRSRAAGLEQTTVLDWAVSWLNVCVNIQVTVVKRGNCWCVVLIIYPSLIWIQVVKT